MLLTACCNIRRVITRFNSIIIGIASINVGKKRRRNSMLQEIMTLGIYDYFFSYFLRLALNLF